HLQANPGLSLPEVARTLQTGRHAFKHRTTVVAQTLAEAADLLSGEKLVSSQAEDAAPPVVFMFPGQGAQYVGMGVELYDREPEFARWIDRGADMLKMMSGIDVRDYICHRGEISEAMAQEQRETRIAQPCLYLVEHAM